MPQYNLYANTGMQFIYTGVIVGSKFAKQNWERLDNDVGWVQYRTTWDDESPEIILCVDTNTGDASHHHLAVSEEAIQTPAVIFSMTNFEVEDDIEIIVRASDNAIGPPKDVALVLDFGNSRSVGLLVEDEGAQQALTFPAKPFDLISHYGRWSNPGSTASHQTVFDSATVFVSDIVPPVRGLEVIEVPARYEEESRSWLNKLTGKKKRKLISESTTIREEIECDLFRDISPVRLGMEQERFWRDPAYKQHGQPLVGLSSPKRYLWSQDIENKYWYQFVTTTPITLQAVSGDFFGYIPEDDHDWDAAPSRDHETQPPTPRYPRRVMMTACIYELLDKAYQQINSIEYRENTSENLRKRKLSEIVMSYPSGLTKTELNRYKTQVNKAVEIFCHAHKLENDKRPSLRMSIDEGTAGQLAYVYGEIKSFRSAESWLEIVGRQGPHDQYHHVRIATIDIGGGTTDLVISDFTDRLPGPATDLLCEIRHVDGANKAGDDLAGAVLQRIIIPQLANQMGLSQSQVRLFFEGITDQPLSDKRGLYLRSIWKKLANRYISMANGDDGSEFLLTDSETITSGLLLDDLEAEIERICNIDYIIGGGLAEKRIVYNRAEFQEVLRELFAPVLAGFCDTICRLDCDLVTLAGRPSDLTDIQELIQSMLPLPKKRIIPMGGYKTGTWYPLPSPKNPGHIDDPKTVVVVGSAIEHLASSNGGLGSLRITISKSIEAPLTYYWGEVSERRAYFRNREAYFRPDDRSNSREYPIQLVGRELVIARRLSARDDSEPTPTYALQLAKNVQPSGIITATVRCERSSDNEDELLVLSKVEGVVMVDEKEVPAVAGTHVELAPRGMIMNEHFLDSGLFLNIDYGKISVE